MKHARMLITTLLPVAILGACSSEQAYMAGREWQRDQCNKMKNMDDRQRCVKEADQPYDRYKQDADAVNARK